MYVYTNFELSEQNINHRLQFKIFRNLTPLKQKYFHRRFHCWYYRVSNLHICVWNSIHSLKLNIKKLSIIIYFLIVYEKKINLHVLVRFLLGNILSGVYILIKGDTPSMSYHHTRWACIEKECICLRCLVMVNT